MSLKGLINLVSKPFIACNTLRAGQLLEKKNKIKKKIPYRCYVKYQTAPFFQKQAKRTVKTLKEFLRNNNNRYYRPLYSYKRVKVPKKNIKKFSLPKRKAKWQTRKFKSRNYLITKPIPLYTYKKGIENNPKKVEKRKNTPSYLPLYEYKKKGFNFKKTTTNHNYKKKLNKILKKEALTNDLQKGNELKQSVKELKKKVKRLREAPNARNDILNGLYEKITKIKVKLTKPKPIEKEQPFSSQPEAKSLPSQAEQKIEKKGSESLQHHYKFEWKPKEQLKITEVKESDKRQEELALIKNKLPDIKTSMKSGSNKSNLKRPYSVSCLSKNILDKPLNIRLNMHRSFSIECRREEKNDSKPCDILKPTEIRNEEKRITKSMSVSEFKKAIIEKMEQKHYEPLYAYKGEIITPVVNYEKKCAIPLCASRCGNLNSITQSETQIDTIKNKPSENELAEIKKKLLKSLLEEKETIKDQVRSCELPKVEKKEIIDKSYIDKLNHVLNKVSDLVKKVEVISIQQPNFVRDSSKSVVEATKRYEPERKFEAIRYNQDFDQPYVETPYENPISLMRERRANEYLYDDDDISEPEMDRDDNYDDEPVEIYSSNFDNGACFSSDYLADNVEVKQPYQYPSKSYNDDYYYDCDGRLWNDKKPKKYANNLKLPKMSMDKEDTWYTRRYKR